MIEVGEGIRVYEMDKVDQNVRVVWRETGLIIVVMFILLFVVAGCGLPDLPEIPEITVEAGTKTLNTVNKLRKTLEEKEILSEEERKLVEGLIEEIERFNSGGGVLGEEGIAQLAVLVEEGLRVGVDKATLNRVDAVADVIDRQPEEWGNEAKDLVNVLDVVGTGLANKIAKDISDLSSQIAKDVDLLMQDGFIEGRCTIDQSGQAINDSAEQVGGKFIASILPMLQDYYEKEQDPVKQAWVCTISPVKLTWQDGKLMPDENSKFIEMTGFNFSGLDLPSVSVESEDGHPYDDIDLYIEKESPYRLQVPIQGKEFVSVTQRSKIVFNWKENVDGRFVKFIDVESKPIPVANFTSSRTSGEAPFSVKFINESTGRPETYYWTFGDGKNSQQEEPETTFDCPGTYDVSLMVDNQYSDPNTLTRKEYITVSAPAPVALFSGNPVEGIGSMAVTFTDQSEGANQYHWNFGRAEGDVETGRGPYTVTYDQPGNYTVKLRIIDDCGVDAESELTVSVLEAPPPPIAAFSASRTGGSAPLEVTFTNSSENNPTSVSWEFGDGSTANTEDVTHIFTEPDTYQVILTVENDYGSDSATKVIEVVPSAIWHDSDWVPVGYHKTHGTDDAEWCPAGHFLVQLDLDSCDSKRNCPIVGNAKCARLGGEKSTEWKNEPSRFPVDIDQEVVFCPNGYFLTSMDYDGGNRCSSGRNCPRPYWAKCAQSPYFTDWTLLPRTRVENSHRNDSGGWCEDGSFLVGLRFRRGGDSGARSYPVVSESVCARPTN